MQSLATMANPAPTDFESELARLSDVGASWTESECSAYCQDLAKSHYENFTVVSFLLPRNLRKDFSHVYAYCRWSDDLADEIGSSEQSLELLDQWHTDLRLCFSGDQPSHPILRALQTTIRIHGLTEEPFADLLSAFRQDQVRFRYDNEPQLFDYCRRSANPVGRILLQMARVSDPQALAWSDDICTALQLANFCQDMHRDAAINRIYAPASLWPAYGLTEESFLAGQVTSDLRKFCRHWVEDTRQLFERGRELVTLVPKWLALDVELFVRGGLATLDAIRKADYDVWTARPALSRLDKSKIGIAAFASLLTRRTNASRNKSLPLSRTIAQPKDTWGGNNG